MSLVDYLEEQKDKGIIQLIEEQSQGRANIGINVACGVGGLLIGGLDGFFAGYGFGAAGIPTLTYIGAKYRHMIPREPEDTNRT